MSVRHLPAVAAAAMLGSIALAAPAAASVQQTAAVAGMTSGRLGPTLTALVGLVGVAIGGLARAGRIGTDNGRRGAQVALVSGLISTVLGGLFAATADGGPGTGNGIVGAFAAVMLGLIGMVLGGLTLNRSRRTSRTG
ncbi:DUF6223 family protein [Nocardia lijiangensis]|uniref:DUF6223 family protein n=1 Tax=Nocardia lijiangensis TaxID=299618 RepID=UPI0008299674|nr:DUF6223 family protein [Nocardia lijiangensis]